MSVSENKQLIQRYPFLLPRRVWTDAVFDDYDYRWTELDRLPEGWCQAFGPEMVEELREILLKANYLNDYRILAVGIDLGCLSWLDKGYPRAIKEEMEVWATKYRKKSAHTCVACGKPATHILPGWFEPYCENCIKYMADDPNRCPSPEEWYRQWTEEDADGLLHRRYPRELW